MVSSVSFGNGVNNNVEFAKKALKYVQGQNIEKEKFGKELLTEAKSSAAMATAYTVIPAASKIMKYGKAAETIGGKLDIAAGTVNYDKEICGKIANIAKDKVLKKEASILRKPMKSLRSFLSSKLPEGSKLASLVSGKTTGEKVTAAARKATSGATGKAKEFVEYTTKSTTAGSFGRSVLKDSKFMMALNMLLQVATQVIPAFKQGGTKEGLKQLGRSTVSAGANAIGYTAGAKLGSMVGVKLAAFAATKFASLGSVAGPIGMIAGGVLGMVLGGLVTSIGGKAIEKVLGKNYTEQVAQEQEQAQAEAIANDPEAMNQLKELVEAKIAQDTQTGKKKAVKNAQKMQEELQNLPQTPVSNKETNGVSFNATTAAHAINNSMRLNSPQAATTTTTNPISQTETTQPQTTAQAVWYPKTMAEATSGLYDQSGMLSIPKFSAIA